MADAVPCFAPGFCVFDRQKQKPYIWRSWPSRRTAERERNDLLAPYAQDSEWRARLVIAEYTGDVIPVSAKRAPIAKLSCFKLT